MKVRLLKNVITTHISMVKRGANNKEIFFMKKFPYIKTETKKTNPKYDIGATYLNVTKSGNKHILKCVVHEPDTIDAQGDMLTAECIENTFYDFMESPKIDREHNFEDGAGTVVEGYIAPIDMEINGTKIKKGSAVIGIRIDEDTYQECLNGDIKSVSMAGEIVDAETIDVDATEFSKSIKNLNNDEKIDFLAEAIVHLLDQNKEQGKKQNQELEKITKSKETDMTVEEINKLVEEKLKQEREKIEKSKKENETKVSVNEKEEREKIEKSLVDTKMEYAKLQKSYEELEKKYNELGEKNEKIIEALISSRANGDNSIKKNIDVDAPSFITL